MTTLKTLKTARALLSDPSKWCQGASARNASGDKVFALDLNACQYCAVGALVRAQGEPGVQSIVSELRAAVPGGKFVSEFNDADGTDHAAVLAMYDATIARLEKAEV